MTKGSAKMRRDGKAKMTAAILMIAPRAMSIHIEPIMSTFE